VIKRGLINDKGEIISFVITQGNVDDRQPLKLESFIRAVSGKLYDDSDSTIIGINKTQSSRFVLCGERLIPSNITTR
jgi:hypothetical protein